MPLKVVNFFVLLIQVLNCVSSAKYPVLIWHSAGETCCGAEGNLYTNFIKKEIGPDVVIKSVKLGNTVDDDFTYSLTVHPFDQINFICEKLQQNPDFHNGYNAIGLSQGGLFLRGLAQSCSFPPMKNLITLGAPHQGVNQYPRCEQMFGGRNCELLKFKLNYKAYEHIMQISIAPASYWHDERNDNRYRSGSTFLAIINNENHINADYIRNLHSLRRFMMVKYKKDVSLIPNESSWFGFVDGSGRTLALEETGVYLRDTLGLRQMLAEGKLIRLESPMEHLKLDKKWFRENITPVLREE